MEWSSLKLGWALWLIWACGMFLGFTRAVALNGLVLFDLALAPQGAAMERIALGDCDPSCMSTLGQSHRSPSLKLTQPTQEAEPDAKRSLELLLSQQPVGQESERNPEVAGNAEHQLKQEAAAL